MKRFRGCLVLLVFAGCTKNTKVPPAPHAALPTPQQTTKQNASGIDVGEVRDVKLSRDGKMLATGTLIRDAPFTGFIQLRDGKTNVVIKQWKVPNGVTTFAFSPDTTLLAVGQPENLSVWAIPSGQLIHKRKIDSGGSFQVTCDFAPNGKTLAVGYGQLLMLDTTTWKPQHTPINIGEPGFVDSVQFSPDGSYLVTTHHDVGNCVVLWNTRTGRSRSFGEGDGGNVVFSRDSQLIAVYSGYDERQTAIWNVKTKKKITIVGNPKSGPPPLAFSTDGKKLICLQYSDSIPQVWGARSGKFVKTSLLHNVVALSPDGKRAVTTDFSSINDVKVETLDIDLF